MRFKLLLASLITLASGMLIYFFFRDAGLLVYRIIKIGATVNVYVTLPKNAFTDFIQYNLSDGLWLVSGILFLRFIWWKNSRICLYYRTIFIGLALLFELLQMTSLVPGVFDVLDIVTMAIFALLEQFINYVHKEKVKWEKER